MLDFETAKKDSWKSKMKLIAGLVVFFWLSLAGNRSVEANVFSTVAAGCVPDNPQTLNGGNYVTTVAGAVTFKPSLPGGTAIQVPPPCRDEDDNWPPSHREGSPLDGAIFGHWIRSG